jgi:fimbrial protein FimY
MADPGTFLGKTLRQIALLQNRPYSRIIYRLSCILMKLGLSHRQELLHLLNNLSDCTFLHSRPNPLFPKAL